MGIRTLGKLVIAVLSTTCLFAISSLADAQTRIVNQQVSNFKNDLRADEFSGYGDEAFTEPVETIKVASAESGIVSSVEVKLGDIVTETELLFELDRSVLEASRELATAKAKSSARLNAAKAEAKQKQNRFEKVEQLIKEQAGSPEELEKAKTDMLIATENIGAIEEELQQQELELERIKRQIERRRVRSPINGEVIELRKKRGEFVSLNDPHVATVVRLDQLRVVFYVPTARATSFQKGDVVDIRMMESNQVAKSAIEYVAPITSSDSGRVRIEVLIENPGGEYRSGIRCRIVDPKVNISKPRISNLRRNPSYKNVTPKAR